MRHRSHEMVAQTLRNAILAGTYEVGDRLPPERQLAEDFAVSRSTVRHALDSLQLQGLVVRRVGRKGGAFVQGERPVVLLNDLRGFLGQLKAQGHEVSTQVVEATTTKASAPITCSLGLVSDAMAHRIVRLRSVSNTPVLIERSWFPAHLCPDMLDKDLDGSLYDLLAQSYSLRPDTKRELLMPGVTGTEDGTLLGVGARLPVLRVDRVSLTDGTAVEYSLDTLRSDILHVRVDTPLH